MEEKIKKWLFDIQSAIEEIDSYFENKKKNFADYKNDLILKRAIERDLAIIGEAVNRILNVNPEIKIENAKNIIGLRNQIIHAYDNISDENIWAILINHLPKLKRDISNLLNE
jgi:uncharacterized protein with HEPN domain